MAAGQGWVLSDVDLLARLTDTEDHFTERKSKGDKGGWIRSTVAFANSTPIGYPAVLFVGVKDDGRITDNGNIEDLMKSYSDSIACCYPPIYTTPRVFTRDGKSCVAVIVPGSESRPHFSGLSYIRDGTQTKPASEEQFRILISERLSKVRELRKWIGKLVTFEIVQRGGSVVVRYSTFDKLADCNQFFVTLEPVNLEPVPALPRSIPIERVAISFDHQRKQLKIEYED